MSRLKDLVALVTGSARYPSTGRTIALRLARDGADVIVHGRQQTLPEPTDVEREMGWRGADSVADEVRALDRRSMVVHGDVSSESDVAAMFRSAGRDSAPLTFW